MLVGNRQPKEVSSSTQPKVNVITNHVINQGASNSTADLHPMESENALNDVDDFDKIFAQIIVDAGLDGRQQQSTQPPLPQLTSIPPLHREDAEFINTDFQQKDLKRGKAGARHQAKNRTSKKPTAAVMQKLQQKVEMQKHECQPQESKTQNEQGDKKEEQQQTDVDDVELDCFSQGQERDAVRTVKRILGTINPDITEQQRQIEKSELEMQQIQQQMMYVERKINAQKNKLSLLQKKKRLLNGLFRLGYNN